MSVNIPYDILCLFAMFGGPKLAVCLASTCRAVKRRIDERYEVTQWVDLAKIWNPYKNFQRHSSMVGKFIAVCAYNASQLECLPSYVQKLRLSSTETREFSPTLQLPSGLIELITVSCQYPKHLKFPEGLKRLAFIGALDIWEFPQHIEELTIGDYTDSLPPLPPNLKKLTFRYLFNLPLIHLPASLEELDLGFNWNQPVHELKLPPRLQKLTFGYNFNQSVDQLQLPSSLKKLTFGFNFNRPVSKLKLPDGLQTLIFGFNFNMPLHDIQWPKGLEQLELGNHFDQTIPDPPPGLRMLYLPTVAAERRCEFFESLGFFHGTSGNFSCFLRPD